MKKVIFVFLALLGTAGVLSVAAKSPSASAYSNGNLISDQVYYNYGSMSQAQIQSFINKFPNSCLKSQNTFPSGQNATWQNTTFKEPLDYFTYGAKTSPARIIYKAAQINKINPQVLLATLEKESDLVSGNKGCAVWRYNSAMGYNCPDGSENALRNHPSLGIYSTCVVNAGNAGFSPQVNHGAWQLSFDGKRANGQTSWLGDGAVTYVGRMTKGNRARVAGGPVTYYDGYTTIDGQRIYLSNGPTAALYNYTPHFNRFAAIFTNWFGSTHGNIFQRLDTPRWMRVKNNSTFKIDVITKENAGEALNAGRQIRFIDKTQVSGKWYLRSEYNYNDRGLYGIAQDQLEEIPYVSISPQWMTFTTSGNRSHPAARTSIGDSLVRGTAVKAVDQITVDENVYYRTEFNHNNNQNVGIHSRFLTNGIVPINLDSARNFCPVGRSATKLNPVNNSTGSTVNDSIYINKKLLLNGHWYFQPQSDNNTNLYIRASDIVDGKCPEYTPFEDPRNMRLVQTTNRLSTITKKKIDTLQKDRIIHFSSKILLNNQWYYRTTQNTQDNVDAVISASAIKDL